tara:strand:- start:315 stop:2186 length:1872 start_codon:yes stop_codon:yes gene_type:complete
MCGFFAVFSLDNNITSLKKKIEEAGVLINHRGPDNKGFYFDKNFGICSFRLSIIDLSSDGNQPMISMDNNFVIGFNGEIYNYKHIRKKLIDKGYFFKGNSDTEVLLNSFLEWGIKCVDKLRGMFSFVIFNKRSKKLYVFRDPLGIKPLYYINKNSNFVISSEIKPILKFYPEEKVINEEVVFRYITRGWVDDTEFTFFKNVRNLPSGCYMKISKDNFHKSNNYIRYFNIEKDRKKIKFNPIKFRKKLEDSVSSHLIADAPLAFTLSGGLDSSTLTALSNKLSVKQEKIRAFSVIPPNTKDETFWINDIVSNLKISHEYVNVDVDNIFSVFDQVVEAQDEPFLSSNVLYQFILRKKISEYGYKVVMVGEGADEVLGGYRRFVNPYLSSLKKENKIEEFENSIKKFTSFLNKSRSEITNSLIQYENMVDMNHDGQENQTSYDLIQRDFYKKYDYILKLPSYPQKQNDEDNRFFSHIFYHMTKRDLPYVLRMEDRNSMFNNIEARVPFLDNYLVENILSHDFKDFMITGYNKSMLRKSLENVLPSSVINRKDKSPRPGSDVHFVYKVFKTQIKKLITSNIFSNFHWFSNDLISEFENDISNLNEKRAEFWFRYYSLGRWIELKINN